MDNIENKGFIYKITSPIGRVYIGQTINLKQRLNSYRNLFCKNQPRLYKSIIKHGWDNHKFEIIHTCFISDIDIFEIFYIKLFDTFDTLHGLNLTSGGKNGVPAKHVIERVRKANTGKKLSTETKEKLRLANIGKKQSDETKAKKSFKLKGLKRTDQTKLNISKARKGMVFSKTHIENMKKSIRPPVSDETKLKISNAQIGRDNSHHIGNKYNGKKVINKLTGEIFATLVDACKYYGYEYDKCKPYLRGNVRNKTPLERFDGSIPTINYYESIKNKRPFHSTSELLVLNMETGIYYDSIIKASKSTIYSAGYIHNMLKGRVVNKTQFILA